MYDSIIPTADTIPVHWLWFQVLLIVTFFIHMILMNFLLGGSLLTAWDLLRGKLEKKATEIAIQYYKTKHYKAAITALESVLDDFPDSENREQILYFMMKSYYYYAINSVDKKRDERFQQTIELYNDIMYLFPDTKYQRELNTMHKNANSKLAN